MKANISRNPDGLARRYSGVRAEQGRLLTDSDWNEQQQVDGNRLARIQADAVGPAAVPAGSDGFALRVEANELRIGAGRLYLGGVLVENTAEIAFTQQPDLPGAALPTADGAYLAYLDLWQRGVDGVEDSALQEDALAGADSAYRLQTIAQTKLLSIGATSLELPPADAPTAFADLLNATPGLLTMRALPAGADPLSCAGGGYTGISNALVRVEIHQPGARGVATFKWSRDNAASSQEWEALDGNEILLRTPQARQPLPSFRAGDWVELIDSGLELENRRGTLVRLEQADGRVLRIDPATLDHYDAALTALDIGDFARGVRRVRRWDMRGPVGALTVPLDPAEWVQLDDGIEIRFDSNEYRSGEYWQAAARSRTRSLLWPCADGSGPLAQPAAGIAHSYTALAYLRLEAGVWSLARDCRRVFASRTSAQLRPLSAFAQTAPPGSVLPGPLSVQITRGTEPLAAARVQFEIIAGATGALLSDPAASIPPGTTLTVLTDATGIASVEWTVGADPLQTVRATLLDATEGGLTPSALFMAEPATAARIAYDRSGASSDTVADRLDALGNDKINIAGDTVSGNLDVQQNLLVRGKLNAQSDVFADAQSVAGDIQFGNQREDRVIVQGELASGNSSGQLEIADSLQVADELIVDGRVAVNTALNDASLSVGGAIQSRSGGFRFPDGTLQSSAGGGSDDRVPAGLEILSRSATPPAGYLATGRRVEALPTGASAAWSAVASLPFARADAMVAAVDGRVYFLGGSNKDIFGNFIYFNGVFRYDPVSGVWDQRANLPFAQGGSGVAVLNNRIHFCSGAFGFTGVHRIHHSYDPVTDTYDAPAQSGITRSFARGVEVNGRMLLIGGFASDGTRLDTVEEYDPDTNSWRFLAPLSEGSAAMGVAALNGLVYAFGGQANGFVSNRTDVYDPIADSWSPRAPLPARILGQTAFTIGDKIYCVGGIDDASVDLATVFAYSPERDHWEREADLPFVTRSPGSAVIDGRAHVIGGVVGTTFLDEHFVRSFPEPYYLHAKALSPGESGRLRAMPTDTGSVQLRFARASSALVPADQLSYRAYYSTENALESLADIDAHGQPAGDAVANIDFIEVNGFAVGQRVYANVVVEDAANNRAVYQGAEVELPYNWRFVDGGQDGSTFNINPAGDAVRPRFANYFQQLAGVWEEAETQNLRVRSTNGLRLFDLEQGGINRQAMSEQPFMLEYRGRLVVAFNEFVPGWRARVRAYDGDSWQNLDNNVGINLSGNNAWGQTLAVINDELYLAYHEDNTNTNRFQVRLMRYNGDLTWTQLDGNSAFSSLNYSTANDARVGNIVGWQGQIWMIWSEGSPGQVRVRARSADGTWRFMDGGGPNGLNFDPTASASSTQLAVFQDQLYCAFSEVRDGVARIRLLCFDSPAEGGQWRAPLAELAGGGGLNYDASRAAFLESLVACDDRLLLSWTEPNGSGVRQSRVLAFDGAGTRFLDFGGSTGLNNNITRNNDYPRLVCSDEGPVLSFNENVSGSRKVRLRAAETGAGSVARARQASLAFNYDDRILIFSGGLREGSVSIFFDETLEYFPATRKFRRLAPMPTARQLAAIGRIGDRIHVVGGGGDIGSGPAQINLHEVYDPATDSWSTAAPIPGTMGEVAGAAIGERMYVVTSASSTLWIYDSVSESWTTGANIPTARGGMAAIAFNGRMYVCGGAIGSANSTAVFAYDPVTNTWESRASMSFARNRIGLVQMNQKIYAISGQISPAQTPIGVIEEYDPLINTWTTVLPLPEVLRNPAVAVVGDTLYSFFGDASNNNTQLRRNVVSRRAHFTWRNAVALPEAQGDAPAVLHETTGEIHVLGSYRNGAPYLNTHTVYDPLSDTYRQATPLPVGLAGGFAVILNDALLYFGGSTDDSTPSADVYEYDFSTDAWTNSRANLPFGHPRCQGGDIDGRVYVVNGVDQLLHVYDPTADSWTRLADLPRVHRDGSVVVYQNRLHVLGGTNAAWSAFELATDVYDPTTDTWSPGPELPDGRIAAAGVVAGDAIHLLGGVNYLSGQSVSRRRSVMKLDSAIDSWSYLPALEDDHHLAAAIALGEEILVFGSRDYATGNVSRRVERYLPGANLPPVIVPERAPFFTNWTERRAMPVALAEPQSAVWQQRIYVFGGQRGFNNHVGESYVYDPRGNEWEQIATMPTPRGNGVAATVGDQIFVMGGTGIRSDANEMYDPLTDTWTPRAPIRTPRNNSCAAVIDGKVYLVSGGNTRQEFDVYDPALDQWTQLTNLGTARHIAMCAAHDGLLYLFGGQLTDGSVTDLAEVYDPVADSWSPLTTMPTPRYDGSVAVVGDLILVIGGYNNTDDFANVEAYNVNANSWLTLSPLAGGPRNALEVQAIGPSVYAMGGVRTASLDYIDRVEQISLPVGTARADYPQAIDQAVLLRAASGRLFGGFGRTATPDTPAGEWYEYDPAADSWTERASGTPRFAPAAAVRGDRLYVFGGSNSTTGYLDTNEIYDPANDRWETGAPLLTALRDATAATGADGRIYLAGGFDDADLAQLSVYDPAADSWSALADLPTARREARAVLYDGRLHILGGISGATVLGDHSVYDPTSNSWSAGVALPDPRRGGTATILRGRMYYLGGRDIAGTFRREILELDPTAGVWRTIGLLADIVVDAAAAAAPGAIYQLGGRRTAPLADFHRIALENPPANSTP